MYCRKEFEQKLEETSCSKPFSLCYNGETLDLSNIVCKVEKGENGREKRSYEVVPGVILLTLDMIFYQDFPVIEYTPYLENISGEDSGILSDISILDLETVDDETFGLQMLNETISCGNSRLTIRYHLGSKAAGSDFLPQKRDLFSRPGANKLALECAGAWCSTDFLPFIGIDSDRENGINLAIGWNGSWKFTAEKEITNTQVGWGKKSRINCGMKRGNFLLHPGERVMQPGILLHFREKKSIREAQNEFRRFMIAHHAPRNSRGELFKPPISLIHWGGLETDKQLARVNLVKEKGLPYENVWIDAGWMGAPGPCPHFLEKSKHISNWYGRVGSWDFNTFAHPKGLRPIADAVHKAGMRLLVWFESLRISSASGAPVITEHPEWLLGDFAAAKEGKTVSFLLNIGLPEARNYILETVSGILEREGIDDYREDFNMDAAPYFLFGETPDRVGIAEMKYVEGFYLFWEELRKRFPDLYIDNCSGGGRRLDYKTATHAFPLCQSDYACYLPYNEECIQLENMYLDDWLPLHGTLNWGEEDLYHAFSGMGGGYASKIWQFNGREPEEDHDYDRHRKVLEWGIALRDIHLKGDVYPLVESPEEDFTKWNGQQIHVPEEDGGMIQLYRRKKSPAPDFRLQLQGLSPDTLYEVTYFSGEKMFLSGKLLAETVIHLEAPGSFQIIKYKASRKG